MLVGVFMIAMVGLYCTQQHKQDPPVSARLEQRPDDSYEVRRGEGRYRSRDYITGPVVLYFDEKTGDYVKLTTMLLANLNGTPVVAGYSFDMRLHYGNPNAARPVNSVGLLADGNALTINGSDLGPRVSYRMNESDGRGGRLHNFYVETELSEFVRFANAGRPEVMIDNKRFALTQRQRDTLRLMGQRGIRGGN